MDKGILIRRGENGRQSLEREYSTVSNAIAALKRKWRTGEATAWHQYEVWDSAGEHLRAWIDGSEYFCVSVLTGGYNSYRRPQ